MKTWILRATAFGLAAALSGAVACSTGSSSGCGGPTTNSSSNPQQTQLSCGTGTHLVGNSCVSDTVNTSAATRYINH